MIGPTATPESEKPPVRELRSIPLSTSHLISGTPSAIANTRLTHARAITSTITIPMTLSGFMPIAAITPNSRSRSNTAISMVLSTEMAASENTIAYMIHSQLSLIAIQPESSGASTCHGATSMPESPRSRLRSSRRRAARRPVSWRGSRSREPGWTSRASSSCASAEVEDGHAAVDADRGRCGRCRRRSRDRCRAIRRPPA